LHLIERMDESKRRIRIVFRKVKIVPERWIALIHLVCDCIEIDLLSGRIELTTDRLRCAIEYWIMRRVRRSEELETVRLVVVWCERVRNWLIVQGRFE